MSGFGLHRSSLSSGAGCSSLGGDESVFNSLECWDYSVEIELAKGAQGMSHTTNN